MAMALATSLPDPPPLPYHPSKTFLFPKRDFGKKQIVQRSCQAYWFSTWPWFHYHATDPDDVVFFHVCVSALKYKGMDQSRRDLAFTSKGSRIGRMPLIILRNMKQVQVTKKHCKWLW